MTTPSPTARLRFGEWTDTEKHRDLAQLLWSDPQVTKLIGGPWSQRRVWDRMLLEMNHASVYGVCYWPIFRGQADANDRSDENDTFVGVCGLRPYEVTSPEHPWSAIARCVNGRLWELGFHLRPRYWSQGYAREAAQSVLQFAFTNPVLCRPIEAGHHPSNSSSSKTLIGLGFQFSHHEYYAPTGLQHPAYMLTPERWLEVSPPKDACLEMYRKPKL
jgi:RimJ/RimL family protein N-acetyltransferase